MERWLHWVLVAMHDDLLSPFEHLVLRTLDAASSRELQALVGLVTSRFRDVYEAVSAFEPKLTLIVDDHTVRLELRSPSAERVLELLARVLVAATHGRFRVEETRVVVEPSRAVLELPSPFLEVPVGLAALANSTSSELLAEWVRQSIEQQLEQRRQPTLEVVAARLGRAPRTLQRSLQGTRPFQVLLDESLRDRASFLVQRRTDLSVKEIAVRLGFSCAPAFSRAVRRWFGENPSELRRRTCLLEGDTVTPP